jgi:hypothetical protein
MRLAEVELKYNGSGKTLSDDNSLDLEAWIDAKTWLRGCPKRLVEIATGRTKGKALSLKDRVYLNRYKAKELAKNQLSF